MKSIVLLLMVAILPWATQAGQESHGGSLVLCAGKEPVVLDYYHAALPTFGNPQPNLMKIEGMTIEQVIDAFRERIKNTGLLRPLNEALRALSPVNHWPLKNLDEVLDSNEPYVLPANCKRIQGAVRQKRRVFLDTNFGRRLSASQLGVLAVHEALFYLSKHKTSEKIRTVIRNIMVLDTPAERLVTSIRDLGIDGYPREALLEFFQGNISPSSPGASFALFESKGNEDLRGCALTFDYFSIDKQKGTISAFYRQPPSSSLHDDDSYLNRVCVGLGKITFECSQDGATCSIKEGAQAKGWANDCKFKPENNAYKLNFQCGINPRTYTFYRR